MYHEYHAERSYALGDCSTIEAYDLPGTAQVAKQKARYLAKVLNQTALEKPGHSKIAPFTYHPRGSMAYIGGWKAIVSLQSGTHDIHQRGFLAWLLWRSAYFTMSVSMRNKILIPVYWLLTWLVTHG